MLILCVVYGIVSEEHINSNTLWMQLLSCMYIRWNWNKFYTAEKWGWKYWTWISQLSSLFLFSIDPEPEHRLWTRQNFIFDTVPLGLWSARFFSFTSTSIWSYLFHLCLTIIQLFYRRSLLSPYLCQSSNVIIFCDIYNKEKWQNWVLECFVSKSV